MSESAFAADLEHEDRAARAAALDVARSFLVQAPAGSGKTELLIQRYLALLAIVERPEAVIAMTFTRKAAGEMRERIVAALRDAQAGRPVESEHAATTRSLAQRALQRDADAGWQLIANPARLTLVTIDAYCAGLAARAPVTTGQGAAPRFVDRAEPLYREAIHAALAALPAGDPAGARLYAHVDGDVDALVELLAALVARRDHWLPLLVDHARGDLGPSLLEALEFDVAAELAVVRAGFPAPLVAALVPLQRHAAAALGDADSLATALRLAADQGGLPPADAAELAAWQSFVDWLLVKSGPQVRRAIDRRCGFPPGDKSAAGVLRATMKEAMTAALGALEAEPGLAAALDHVRVLPPVAFATDSRSLVDALFALLPAILAALQATFRAHRAIDFTEGVLRALAALGSDESPEELLLRLDGIVAHLLIDEFQDTSYAQLELLRRLTAGFVPGDGRTLFAVGDPMQSIYRFRAAEVRLFLDAQASGMIGDIPVTRLLLRRNFRAQCELVEWVNAVFPTVLGTRSDPWRGQVAFAPALPQRPALPIPGVQIEFAADIDAEARCVAAAVRAALARGAREVAILVRARTHLVRILPLLREAGIAYTAVDLETLAERAAIRDLAALAHALAQPADRLAWLAVLRAPWCGLTLEDLHAVASAAAQGPLLAAVLEPDAVANLGADGRHRLLRLVEAIGPTLDARGRAPLASRVRGAWLSLGGPATLDETVDVEAAERFFALLREHERAGDIADWGAFVDALAALQLGGEPDAAAGQGAVRVMTLHRAKGLEFDTVILPGLARATAPAERPLLRWRRRPQGLLVAPGRARGGAEDPLYRYLGVLAQDEADAELARLLYVGCTRAKAQLHLIATLGASDGPAESAWCKPPPRSALAALWPGLRLPGIPVAGPAAEPVPSAPAPAPALRRLPSGWDPPLPDAGLTAEPAQATSEAIGIVFDWAQTVARHVGVVAHRMFAEIGRTGLDAWPPERLHGSIDRLRAELADEGVVGAELDGAVAAVLESVEGLLADPRGRWLFDRGHADVRGEWALTGVLDDEIVRVVVDRSFVADGVRWIVDFKTGVHEGADVDGFLAREEERYRPQLDCYAALLRLIDPRPIRLGLYFPRLKAWREWAYAG
jgi:ATP-dependent exoDNAse (exonuclease V) beta subunit